MSNHEFRNPDSTAKQRVPGSRAASSAVLARWSVGCGSGLGTGVWRGNRDVGTEMQPSDWLLQGQPCGVTVTMAGVTVVQGAGKGQGAFHGGGWIW